MKNEMKMTEKNPIMIKSIEMCSFVDIRQMFRYSYAPFNEAPIFCIS